MKIRNRFIITLAVFGVAFVIMAVSIIETNQEAGRFKQQEEIARSIERAARELSYLSNDYLLHGETQLRSRWESTFSSLSAELSNLQPDSPEQAALVNNIRTNRQRLKEIFTDVASLRESGSPFPTAAVGLEFLQVSWSRMEVQNQGIIFDALRLSQMLDDQVEGSQRRDITLVSILLGIVGAYLAANYLLIYRRILRSLSALHAGTRVVGSGNLDFTIAEQQKDEIGDLSRAFNRMTANLKSVTASKADLEDEIARRRQAETQTERRKSVQDGINRILQAYLTCATREELGLLCLKVAQDLTQSKFGFIDELGDDGLLHAVAISNPGWELCAMSEKAGHGKTLGTFAIRGLYGAAIRDARSLLSNDPSSHPDSTGTPPGHPALKAFLGVPLVRVDKAVGVLALANREGGYRSEELETAEALAPAILEVLTRKKAEARISHLASFPDLNPLPVVEMDMAGRIAYINPAARRLFPDLAAMGTAHPFLADWEKVVNVVRDEDGEHPVREVNIGDSWYEQTMRFLPSASAIRIYGHDITERKKSDQVKDEFIGLVSHELRTPLTVVMGSLYTAMKEGLTEEDQRFLMQNAVEGAESLKLILENLLELSRFQAGRLALHKETVSIGSVARKTAEQVQRRYPMASFLVEIPDDLPVVHMDPTRVQQVLHNLLDNAVKYSDAGGEVAIFGRSQDACILVGVKDSGIGISAEDRAKLFQPFQRLENAAGASAKGTGLGLVVCKRLVEAHGGTIWVESEPGQGSTFFFTIPLEGEEQVVSSE
ncbi:MAG: GAF domain-containing protein [Chloroflexi bacterium]|nr:GAF domain-containing protein [Chloroflexota bacterium]